MVRPLFLFTSAFLLNAVWEYAHSFLYVHYRGGAITDAILLQAAFFDAVMITIMGVFFLYVPFFRRRSWLAIVAGVLVAVVLEWYALATGRWAYTSAMLIIPFLRTGLTPTIQLGVLAYGILKLQERWYRRQD